MADSPGVHDRDLSAAAIRSRQRHLAGRDIGEIPPIANIDRRESTRNSLRLFCETYNPEAFYFNWSRDHLKAIARIEEAVIHGALYALAMDRGKGKTTLCRMAVLWAVSHSLKRYPFLIGANASKAEDSLDAIKTFIRFLPVFAEDFPEIWTAVDSLGGIANRASGQVCGGESTMIQWSKDRIVLPRVPPPANWPKAWPLMDGLVPSSGCVIGVSGLTGDGIRGSNFPHPSGEQLRPDLVILDDPQTDESAGSPAQNATREGLVAGAVLGMAGPGRPISAVMPCTVIRQGDFIDRILDRSIHPLWRGERCKMLVTMPADMSAWDAYFDIRRRCAVLEPPDYSEANEYYLANRAVLDAGAEASWEERKLPDEVSAIQSAMNLYMRNPRAFMAEYQNTPMPDIDDEPETVTPAVIVAKLNRHERYHVPAAATRLTAFIDIQKNSLWYVVVAWEENFSGHVVDYGVWPDQKREYYSLADIKLTLQDVTGASGIEGSVFAGLTALTAQLFGRVYPRDDEVRMKIDRCLIDANWGDSTNTVYKFCRESVYSGVVLPSHGKYIGPGSQPFAAIKTKPGERAGENWRIPLVVGTRQVRHVVFDTNAWKSFVYARLAVSAGDRGSISLFGDKADRHRMLADHWTAEKRDRQTSEKTERKVDVWTNPARRDNHWFDGIVGACVAASIEGVKLSETTISRDANRKPKVSFADQQRAAMQRQRGR
jgi:hypothetical protein